MNKNQRTINTYFNIQPVEKKQKNTISSDKKESVALATQKLDQKLSKLNVQSDKEQLNTKNNSIEEEQNPKVSKKPSVKSKSRQIIEEEKQVPQQIQQLEQIKSKSPTKEIQLKEDPKRKENRKNSYNNKTVDNNCNSSKTKIEHANKKKRLKKISTKEDNNEPEFQSGYSYKKKKNYKRHMSKASDDEQDEEDDDEWQQQDEEDEGQNKDKDNSDEELNLERFAYEDPDKKDRQKQKNIKSMIEQNKEKNKNQQQQFTKSEKIEQLKNQGLENMLKNVITNEQEINKKQEEEEEVKQMKNKNLSAKKTDQIINEISDEENSKHTEKLSGSEDSNDELIKALQNQRNQNLQQMQQQQGLNSSAKKSCLKKNVMQIESDSDDVQIHQNTIGTQSKNKATFQAQKQDDHLQLFKQRKSSIHNQQNSKEEEIEDVMLMSNNKDFIKQQEQELYKIQQKQLQQQKQLEQMFKSENVKKQLEQQKKKDNNQQQIQRTTSLIEKGSKSNGKGQDTAIEIEDNLQDDSQKIFKDKTIVVTGLFQNLERAALENLLKDLGARVTGSVSKKTNYLIYGYQLEDGRPVETSNKFKQATEKGTKKLNEAELEEIITKRTGKLLSDYNPVDDIIKQISSQQIEKKSSPQQPFRQLSAQPLIPAKKSPISKAAIVPQQQQQQQQQQMYQPTKQRNLWTTLYAPQVIDDIIGNKSQIANVIKWLINYQEVVVKGNKIEGQQVSYRNAQGFWNKSNPNARACLISGPPGIGKTSSVRLLAKQLGYQLIESNASDVRNKNAVDQSLNDLKSNQLLCFQKQNQDLQVNNKFIILMDEVDGMSSGDRGGNQMLIQQIKNTKIPIICICNDRQSPKVRTLANYCYDIQFQKPPKEFIGNRMLQICQKEGINIDIKSLQFISESMGNDIRQIINSLQMLKNQQNISGAQGPATVLNLTTQFIKDQVVMVSNFEAAGRLLSRVFFNKQNIRQLQDMFFVDYDLIPLIVQQNYLRIANKKSAPPSIDNQNAKNRSLWWSQQEFDNIVTASECIAESDIISKSIRVNGEWSLLASLGFLSSIYPTEKISQFAQTPEQMSVYPVFPDWLGKNSSQRKINRELKELRQALGHNISGSRFSMKFDYAQPLLLLILHNLYKGKNYIQNVIQVLINYSLTPELMKEHLANAQYPNNSDPYADIETQVKSSLTRTYNNRFKDTTRGKKMGKKGKKDGENEGKFDKNTGEVVESDSEGDENNESDEDQDQEEVNEEKNKNKSLTSVNKNINFKPKSKK